MAVGASGAAGSATCARPATTAAAGGCSRRWPARCPTSCAAGAVEHDGRLLVPLTAEAGRGAPRAAVGAAGHRRRALPVDRRGRSRSRRRRGWCGSAASTASSSGSRWCGTRTSARRSTQLPGAEGTRAVPLDPWLAERARRVHRAATASQVTAAGRRGAGAAAARSAAAAADAVRRSRADRRRADRAEVASALGGELAPFQWAGVRYVLDARRAFLADEQGLGKTVEALAALEADGAYPAIVVCPASMKLDWQREAAQVAAAPHRSRSSRARGAVPPTRRHHDPQLRDRRRPPRGARAPAPARARRRRVALLQEPARQAHPGGPPAGRAPCRRDGLRLALTGTPVLNHAEELIAQLRVIGRLEDFGSGARFSPPVPGRAQRGAAALAPAPPLLRAAAEVRGAAAAAGQAPGRRARCALDQRAPSTGWPSAT